jgi:hypothetical protein
MIPTAIGTRLSCIEKMSKLQGRFANRPYSPRKPPNQRVYMQLPRLMLQGNRIWDSSLKDLEQIWVIPNGPIGSAPGVLQFFPFYGRFTNRP